MLTIEVCHIYCIPVTHYAVYILEQCDSLRNNHEMLSWMKRNIISDCLCLFNPV